MSWIGAWRVSEAVYDADGRFQGLVRQLRRLEPISNGRLRVIQICEPDRRLAGHPMAEFAGEHRFELVIEGRLRRYLGPAVVGHGLSLGAEATIGSGVWPDFGYNFSSWAVPASAERQLTGGTFHLAGREMAVIAGLAIADSGVWPEWPSAAPRASTKPLGTDRQGTLIEVDDSGAEVRHEVTRRDRREGWAEWVDGSRRDVSLAADGDRIRLTGTGSDEAPWVGFARRFGPLLSYRAAARDALVHGLEISDGAGRLAGIRRWHRCAQPERFEVLRTGP